MKVSFHLRKASTREPAAALLALSPAVADDLEVCTRLSLEPLP